MGADEHEMLSSDVREIQDRCDLLVFLQGEEVDDRLTLCRPLCFRDLIGGEREGSSGIREEEEVIMVLGREDALHLVFVLHGNIHSFSSSPLGPEEIRFHSLDVGILREGDDDILIRYGIFRIEFSDCPFVDEGPSRISELGFELFELSSHDGTHPFRIGEDILEIGDEEELLGKLVLDLLPLKTAEPLELHLEDGLCLPVAQPESLHQVVMRIFPRFRGLYGRDDLVDMIKGNLQTFEDVGSRFGDSKLVSGPSDDDFPTVFQKLLEDFEQIEELRLETSLMETDHVESEGSLQRSELVELIQNLLRERILLELDDDPYRILVRLVTDVADSHDDLLSHEIGNLDDEIRFVQLIRDL